MRRYQSAQLMTQSTKRDTRILAFSPMALVNAPEALLWSSLLHRVSMYRRYHLLDPISQSAL